MAEQMIIADSNFFIALFRVNDGFHNRAVEIMDDLNGRNEILVVTTHVVEEAVTYVFSREGSDRAFDVAQAIVSSENLSIESVTKQDIVSAAETMRKYKKLSLSDSLSVGLARKLGIGQILSFDSGFDHIQGIRRVC